MIKQKEKEIRCFNDVKDSFYDMLTKRCSKLKCDYTDTNLDEVYNILSSAFPNPSGSRFPDFVFSNGFIEHFQVSAANENKKGSKHNIAVNDFERGSNENIERLKNEFLQSPPRKNPVMGTYDMKVVKHEMICPKYSYESFIKSFKRNFDKHILSLQKYTGEKSIGIFLIELAGANITVMQNGRFLELYRLAVDQELLTYINQYAEYLKYIIFASADRYEILELNEIPKLLDNLPHGLTFGVGRFINEKLCLFIDI